MKNQKTLDSLYLAKLEPDRWMLSIYFSREEKCIEKVEIEQLQFKAGILDKIMDYFFK